MVSDCSVKRTDQDLSRAYHLCGNPEMIRHLALKIGTDDLSSHRAREFVKILPDLAVTNGGISV